MSIFNYIKSNVNADNNDRMINYVDKSIRIRFSRRFNETINKKLKSGFINELKFARN